MAVISNPIQVRAERECNIWVLFSDGTSGKIDLSDLAGKGVFKKWDTTLPFSSVHINPANHVIAWDDELEIDADNIYLQLIGKTFEEYTSSMSLQGGL